MQGVESGVFIASEPQNFRANSKGGKAIGGGHRLSSLLSIELGVYSEHLVLERANKNQQVLTTVVVIYSVIIPQLFNSVLSNF
jgi:hypothetical protein